jgi:hypothetical protein
VLHEIYLGTRNQLQSELTRVTRNLLGHTKSAWVVRNQLQPAKFTWTHEIMGRLPRFLITSNQHISNSKLTNNNLCLMLTIDKKILPSSSFRTSSNSLVLVTSSSFWPSSSYRWSSKKEHGKCIYTDPAFHVHLRTKDHVWGKKLGDQDFRTSSHRLNSYGSSWI